jgi:hypothetical protein
MTKTKDIKKIQRIFSSYDGACCISGHQIVTWQFYYDKTTREKAKSNCLRLINENIKVLSKKGVNGKSIFLDKTPVNEKGLYVPGSIALKITISLYEPLKGNILK